MSRWFLLAVVLGSALPVAAVRADQPDAGGVPATIVVRVPSDADLFFEGNPTRSRAPVREFVTPPLVPGQDYYYTVEAQVYRNGQWHTDRRDIAVRPGDTTQLRLLPDYFVADTGAGYNSNPAYGSAPNYQPSYPTYNNDPNYQQSYPSYSNQYPGYQSNYQYQNTYPGYQSGYYNPSYNNQWSGGYPNTGGFADGSGRVGSQLNNSARSYQFQLPPQGNRMGPQGGQMSPGRRR